MLFGGVPVPEQRVALVRPGRIEGTWRPARERLEPPAVEAQDPWDSAVSQPGTASAHGFTIEGLAPGWTRVVARWSDGSALQALVQVRAGETSLVELTGSARLHGRVLCAGEPVAGVEVLLRGEFDQAAERQLVQLGWARATTDDQGRYLMEALSAGRYVLERSRLCESGVAWSGSQIGLAEGEEIELDLELGSCAVSGRVIGGDGLPVAALVRFDQSGGALHTGGDGRFELAELTAGVWELEVVPTLGSSSGPPPVRRTVRVDLAEGERRELDVRLEAGGTIQLRVRDPLGRPLWGPDFDVRRVDLDPMRGPSWHGEGQVSVEPGEYLLFFEGPDGKRWTLGPKKVGVGETLRFELQID
jgi:hypothetical protein